MRIGRSIAITTLVGTLALAAAPAHAQNTGFQINRYEPTPAGEWLSLIHISEPTRPY